MLNLIIHELREKIESYESECLQLESDMRNLELSDSEFEQLITRRTDIFLICEGIEQSIDIILSASKAQQHSISKPMANEIVERLQTLSSEEYEEDIYGDEIKPGQLCFVSPDAELIHERNLEDYLLDNHNLTAVVRY